MKQRYVLRRFCSFGSWTRRPRPKPKKALSIANDGKLAGVPHYDIELSEETYDDKEKVLIEQINPLWNDDTYVRRWELCGGYINKTIAYAFKAKRLRRNEFDKNTCIEKVVVRIQRGQDELSIERAMRELRNMEELAEQNIIPRLYCTFENGYCCEFVEGKVCVPSDFTSKRILRRSATLTANLHSLRLSENYLSYYDMRPAVFKNLRKYIDAIPLQPNGINFEKYLGNGLPSVDELRAEDSFMSKIIRNLDNLVITYCHNDLHSSNLILDPSGAYLQCIDHEFGGPNYSAFDIANHFNEFCGIADFNNKLYPSKNTQLWWLRKYLKELNGLEGRTTNVSDAEVENLYNVVQIMSLLSNLFWSAWAFVPENHADKNFDYVGYGITRLNTYYSDRDKILNTIDM